MRVVLLTQHDYAGAGYNWAKAARNAGVNAQLIRFWDRDTPADFTIYHGFKNNREWTGFFHSTAQAREEVMPQIDYRVRKAQSKLDSADVIHLIGDWPVQHYDNTRLFIDVRKPIVVSPVGSLFRRAEKGKKWCVGKWPMDIHKNFTNARAVATADLNYEEFESEYLGLALDTENQPILWTCPTKNNVVPHIVHSPSCRINKGTNTLFLPALKLLKERGIAFTHEIVENQSLEYSIERKSEATIFFGQKGIGWFATSTLEAAQFGVPCVNWLDEVSIKQSNEPTPPIQSFEPTPEGLAKTFERMLETDLQELSTKTKQWVDKRHSYKAIGNRLKNIYTKAQSAPKWKLQ